MGPSSARGVWGLRAGRHLPAQGLGPIGATGTMAGVTRGEVYFGGGRRAVTVSLYAGVKAICSDKGGRAGCRGGWRGGNDRGTPGRPVTMGVRRGTPLSESDRKELGLTESNTGRGWFLLSFLGRDRRGYYCVAHGTGPIPRVAQFLCTADVLLSWTVRAKD